MRVPGAPRDDDDDDDGDDDSPRSGPMSGLGAARVLWAPIRPLWDNCRGNERAGAVPERAVAPPCRATRLRACRGRWCAS
jgi:hypothetical protein